MSSDIAMIVRLANVFAFGPKLFFALDVLCARASSAALDERESRTGRRSNGIRHMFPCGIRTAHCHSQSIACWPFLSRDSQPHLPNSSFLRLHTIPACLLSEQTVLTRKP